jgi:hypothetical protein
MRRLGEARSDTGTRGRVKLGVKAKQGQSFGARLAILRFGSNQKKVDPVNCGL